MYRQCNCYNSNIVTFFHPLVGFCLFTPITQHICWPIWRTIRISWLLQSMMYLCIWRNTSCLFIYVNPQLPLFISLCCFPLKKKALSNGVKYLTCPQRMSKQHKKNEKLKMTSLRCNGLNGFFNAGRSLQSLRIHLYVYYLPNRK